MPDGTKHTGWVEIDDFCGDNSDDSYCFQTVGGKSYPNTDLYIGDFTKSGMKASSGDCSGPAGNGQELTNVYTGSPGSAWIRELRRRVARQRQVRRLQQRGVAAGREERRLLGLHAADEHRALLPGLHEHLVHELVSGRFPYLSARASRRFFASASSASISAS